MAKRLKKVPQPPIDPARRPTEARHVVLGAAIGAVGAALLAAGLLTSHRLGAENVPHPQLVKLVTHGGVKVVEAAPGPAGGQTDRTTIKKVEKPPEDCPT